MSETCRYCGLNMGPLDVSYHSTCFAEWGRRMVSGICYVCGADDAAEMYGRCDGCNLDPRPAYRGYMGVAAP